MRVRIKIEFDTESMQQPEVSVVVDQVRPKQCQCAYHQGRLRCQSPALEGRLYCQYHTVERGLR